MNINKLFAYVLSTFGLRLFVLPLFLASLTAPVFALADSKHLNPERLSPLGYTKHYTKSGDTYIAGQPTGAALKKLKRQGVTAVINLRTASEMADAKEVPYDEAKEVRALGLDYIHIPMNGKKRYSEKSLDQFIQAYEAHGGKVLLHCRSAKRASQLWTAFLVKHEGMKLEDARLLAKSINLGDAPLNGLLGDVKMSPASGLKIKLETLKTKEKAHL
jgi:uncharacterized protein (TIGR01244 family)